MTDPNGDSTPAPAEKPTAGQDLEAQESSIPPPPQPSGDVHSGAQASGMPTIMDRWKRQDLLGRCSMASRGLGFVFSLLAFIIMASNKHGGGMNYDEYEEYRYLLAISVLATLYAGAKCLRQFHELSTGRELFSLRINFARIDFIGDQILAYLLMSAASSAVPMTDRMREGADNIFTDASAAAISMAFFAFFSLASSALLSGYKLSNQTYI